MEGLVNLAKLLILLPAIIIVIGGLIWFWYVRNYQ
jgi:cytochrome c-type biogenesis protein CcmH/NrfF